MRLGKTTADTPAGEQEPTGNVTFMKPLGAVLRHYRSEMQLVWGIADSWVEMWADRVDPRPPPPPDNVVDLSERRLRAIDRR